MKCKSANKKSKPPMKRICRQRESDKRNEKQATWRGDQKKGDVAQSSRRVKDKRLRRACGILDTAG